MQTGTQTTPDGEFCFFTGNALPTDGIGANDVDGGSTTLLSPVIDMTAFVHPVISYNRWYTNSPPSGANPGADWFQVMASNDNGQNWVYIENTSTSDMSWRRNAFRVEDWLAPTAQMRFKFIASDSLHPELNLSGGSLVEAAMDDFILFDEYVPQQVSENELTNLFLFPNPSNQFTTVVIPKGFKNSELRVFDVSGKCVFQQTGKFNETVVIDGRMWSPGVYQVVLKNNNQLLSNRWLLDR